MNAVKIHLFLLTYLPVLGFGIYGIMTGFGNDLFIKILISGWIVVVIYQTILTAVYTPPPKPALSILSLLIPPVLLLLTASLNQTDHAIVFIEMAAIDMMGIIIGLNIAFIHKGVKDGIKEAPVIAILFTVGIILTAGFFLGKLFYHFFEEQSFDWISIGIVFLGVGRSVYFFASRLAGLTNRMGAARKSGQSEESVKPKKEMSASGILITIGIWFIVVPLMIWIRSLIIPFQ